MSTSPDELPPDEHRPVEVEEVPAEEGISEADVADRVDLEPEEQENFPDQHRTAETPEEDDDRE